MVQQDKKRLGTSLLVATIAVALIWVVHFLIWVTSVEKSYLANIPRVAQGLIGIITSPLVHDDLAHLLGNSAPLFVFLAATWYFYSRSALRALSGIWLLTGLWVWVLAHEGSHIGASGVVYGLGSYLFFSGVFRMERLSLIVALLVMMFYGGMVAGFFPIKQHMSWESHLFGALAGMGMAWLLRKVDRTPKKTYSWENEPEHDPRDVHAEWNYRQNWPGANEYFSSEDAAPHEDGRP